MRMARGNRKRERSLHSCVHGLRYRLAVVERPDRRACPRTIVYATFLPESRVLRISSRLVLSVCFGRMAGTGPGYPHPFGTRIDRIPDPAGPSHLQLPLLQRLAPNKSRAEGSPRRRCWRRGFVGVIGRNSKVS